MEKMDLMTAQPSLPSAPVASATRLGAAVDLVEDKDGGQVFLHGMLFYVWDAGDDAIRRFVAVKLWGLKTAKIAEIAAAFRVGEDTVWRWQRTLKSEGFASLSNDKPGPKGVSKLTASVIARIHELKKTRLTNTSIGTQVGVSEFSVRRALTLTPAHAGSPKPVKLTVGADAIHAEAEAAKKQMDPGAAVRVEFSVLPTAMDRPDERLAASFGSLTEVPPVFARAARVPLAGMLFALPALENTGLLRRAANVFTGLLH
jgi:transposase